MQITRRRKSIRPVESITTTEKSSVTRNTASSLAKLKDVSTKKRTATKKLSSLDTLQKRNSLVDKKASVSLETSESPVDFPKRLSEEVNIAGSKMVCLANVLNQKKNHRACFSMIVINCVGTFVLDVIEMFLSIQIYNPVVQQVQLNNKKQLIAA